MEHFKFCPYCRAKLKKGDVDGRQRLYCADCGWINYRNPVPVAVCLLRDERKRLLLIKRAIDPCAGSWALAGGFIEMGESVEEAGVRELLEETGLYAEPVRVTGARVQRSATYGYVLVVGVECRLAGGGVLSPGDDAAEAAFFDVNDLPEIPFSAQVALIDDYLGR
ncbi:MAG: NUDIX domain-containing protein [Candidatus Omnitrophica bacterium]|nr:NUDIX domain-containing protein [Candidatus Omnitrophota bacterium]